MSNKNFIWMMNFSEFLDVVQSESVIMGKQVSRPFHILCFVQGPLVAVYDWFDVHPCHDHFSSSWYSPNYSWTDAPSPFVIAGLDWTLRTWNDSWNLENLAMILLYLKKPY